MQLLLDLEIVPRHTRSQLELSPQLLPSPVPTALLFSKLLPITQVHLPGLGLCLLEPFQFSILLLRVVGVQVEERVVFTGDQVVEAEKSSRALPLCQETLQ